MKRFVTLIVVMIMAFTVSLASARLVGLNVEVSYNPPHPDQYAATAWRLYMDGAIVCSSDTDVVDGIMICPEFEVAPGEYDFTASVLYVDGTESPQSAAFPFFIPLEDSPQPTILEMGITVNGEPVVLRGVYRPVITIN